MNTGDLARESANTILVGVIKEINEAEATVRVDADGMVTDWIPWVALRAGAGVRCWDMPEAGEQVAIACPYGDLAQAFVIGSLYQNAHAAPANRKTLHRTEYADGTVVEYDRQSKAMRTFIASGGTLTLTVNNTTTLTLEGSKATLKTNAFHVDAPATTMTGTLTVDGKITGKAAADITGDVTVTSGDVKADAISLKLHKHGGVAVGSGTTGASVP